MSNSSRERVLKVYPRAWEHPDTGFIWDGGKSGLCEIYLGDSWDEVAKLSSPAGETPTIKVGHASIIASPLNHNVPEPVPTGGSAEQSDDYRPNPRSLSNAEVRATGLLCGGAVQAIARELLERRVAAPIAPAAVSETGTFEEWWLDNVNDLRIEAEEADEDDGLFCARAAWNAAYVRQKLKSVSSQTASAEGDGWIAVTAERDRYKAALEYIIVLDNLYLGRDFKDGAKGSNYAHVRNIAEQMVDCAESTLLPAPPVNEEGKIE